MLATISGSTVLAVVVSAVSTAVILVLIGAATSLRRTARDMRALADELNEHAAAVLSDIQETATTARQELARVDDLVGSAEALTETVGSAARLAHAALANPLIKVMAFGAGTARAGRRLRRTG